MSHSDSTVSSDQTALPVVWEDQHLRALAKPSGLSVLQDNTGQLSLGEVYRDRFGEEPLFVHRLDKGTSGILLVARCPAARAALQRAFAQHTVRKAYLALVMGSPPQPRGSITAPLQPGRKGRYRIAAEGSGKSARTDYQLIASKDQHSLLLCLPQTGRTHQIRLHLAHLGTPLVLDPLYGLERRKPSQYPRLTLHAWQVAFPHPADPARMHLQAPLPVWAESWQGVLKDWPVVS